MILTKYITSILLVVCNYNSIKHWPQQTLYRWNHCFKIPLIYIFYKPIVGWKYFTDVSDIDPCQKIIDTIVYWANNSKLLTLIDMNEPFVVMTHAHWIKEIDLQICLEVI